MSQVRYPSLGSSEFSDSSDSSNERAPLNRHGNRSPRRPSAGHANLGLIQVAPRTGARRRTLHAGVANTSSFFYGRCVPMKEVVPHFKSKKNCWSCKDHPRNKSRTFWKGSSNAATIPAMHVVRRSKRANWGASAGYEFYAASQSGLNICLRIVRIWNTWKRIFGAIGMSFVVPLGYFAVDMIIAYCLAEPDYNNWRVVQQNYNYVIKPTDLDSRFNAALAMFFKLETFLTMLGVWLFLIPVFLVLAFTIQRPPAVLSDGEGEELGFMNDVVTGFCQPYRVAVVSKTKEPWFEMKATSRFCPREWTIKFYRGPVFATVQNTGDGFEVCFKSVGELPLSDELKAQVMAAVVFMVHNSFWTGVFGSPEYA